MTASLGASAFVRLRQLNRRADDLLANTFWHRPLSVGATPRFRLEAAIETRP
jgi:hypothetical protein